MRRPCSSSLFRSPTRRLTPASSSLLLPFPSSPSPTVYSPFTGAIYARRDAERASKGKQIDAAPSSGSSSAVRARRSEL